MFVLWCVYMKKRQKAYAQLLLFRVGHFYLKIKYYIKKINARHNEDIALGRNFASGKLFWKLNYETISAELMQEESQRWYNFSYMQIEAFFWAIFNGPRLSINYRTIFWTIIFMQIFLSQLHYHGIIWSQSIAIICKLGTDFQSSSHRLYDHGPQHWTSEMRHLFALRTLINQKTFACLTNEILWNSPKKKVKENTEIRDRLKAHSWLHTIIEQNDHQECFIRRFSQPKSSREPNKADFFFCYFWGSKNVFHYNSKKTFCGKHMCVHGECDKRKGDIWSFQWSSNSSGVNFFFLFRLLSSCRLIFFFFFSLLVSQAKHLSKHSFAVFIYVYWQ